MTAQKAAIRLRLFLFRPIGRGDLSLPILQITDFQHVFRPKKYWHAAECDAQGKGGGKPPRKVALDGVQKSPVASSVNISLLMSSQDSAAPMITVSRYDIQYTDFYSAADKYSEQPHVLTIPVVPLGLPRGATHMQFFSRVSRYY